jgi:antitoxin component of MazEF toxin-antitoxin module
MSKKINVPVNFTNKAVLRGNSVTITIPKNLVDFMKIKQGDMLAISMTKINI